MRVVEATKESFEEAAIVLRHGGVVAYPTETVYGLAVDPLNEAAVQRLFDVKGRADTNPVLLIVGDVAQLDRVVDFVPPEAYPFMDAFWPGPLSLVLPAAAGYPKSLLAGGSTVCVRCPACPIARGLCAIYGRAVTSSSANRSGATPARSLDDLDLPGIELAIDGGVLSDSSPSTVFDPVRYTVFREGPITEEMLEAVSKKR